MTDVAERVVPMVGREAELAHLHDVWAEVEDWFCEQVEILPVFYGMDHAPHAFVERVAALLRAHGAEAQGHLDRAYGALERVLAAAGAEPGVARSAWQPDIPTLWSLLRRGHSAARAVEPSPPPSP